MSQEIVKKSSKKENPLSKISGYGSGTVDVVMSVDQVAKEAEAISVSAPEINKLADFIILKKENLEIEETFISGKSVYKSE